MIGERAGRLQIPYRQSVHLSELPTSGVSRLRGTSVDALAAAADRRRPEDPVVIVPGLTAPLPSAPAAIIDDVLARVTAIAFELFPAWLPNPEQAPESGAVLDRIAARSLTHRHDGAPGIGAALGALATASLRPQHAAAFTDLPALDRREALEYALTHSYPTVRLALALVLDEQVEAHRGDALSVAAQWLARGGCAVWLLGRGTAHLDRFPVVDGPPPALTVFDAPSGSVLSGLRPEPVFPPLSGRPHPASAAEGRLEQGLASAAWAASRHWNHTVDLGRLHPPVRVDLLFPGVRLVVEVDGADHRTPDKYEADRRRDADLMLSGYRVLRFTNARIMGDLSEALSIIRRLVSEQHITGGGAW